ncbi:MAG TPA: hypothetical protein PK359_18175 [Burkholderiaceae bacterium]|jgi:hypothetical protein|nr:hypothetical protein [Burkholderiaceae bacterium]
MSDSSAVSLAPSFGALVDGVRLVLPAGVPVIYLTEAAVHPLAGAPARVVGLMQIQGHPVVVLDASRVVAGGAPALRRHAVLVLGAPGDSGALRVDEAPAPIALGEPRPEAVLPACAFASALHDPVGDAAEPARVWWHFEPARLFEALAAAPGADS